MCFLSCSITHTFVHFWRVHVASLYAVVDGFAVRCCDVNIYVDRKSSHPLSVKKSLPYGLGIRLRRICSRESDYLKRRQELKSYLRKRGYSSALIERQLVKVDKLKRSDLLLYKPKKQNQNSVPLVVTYAKQLPDIQK